MHFQDIPSDEALDELGSAMLHLRRGETSIYQPSLQETDSPSSSTDLADGSHCGSDAAKFLGI